MRRLAIRPDRWLNFQLFTGFDGGLSQAEAGPFDDGDIDRAALWRDRRSQGHRASYFTLRASLVYCGDGHDRQIAAMLSDGCA